MSTLSSDALIRAAQYLRMSSENQRYSTENQQNAIAEYADLHGYALWAEAMEAIQKYGTMIKSPSGYPTQSPYFAVENRQAEILMRIASEFGFTPASRGRISTPSPSELRICDPVAVTARRTSRSLNALQEQMIIASAEIGRAAAESF